MSENLRLQLDQVEKLADDFFKNIGFSPALATTLARRIRLAERDGPASHGLAMLAYYKDIVTSGRINLDPAPEVIQLRPAMLAVDCDNSFAQFGLEAVQKQFTQTVREQGCATLITRRAHHIAALRHDILPLAEAGLIVIMMSGSRPWVVPHGGRDPVFGTNPMAFACPRDGGPPIVWDQAVSKMAISDVRLAEKENVQFDDVIGLDDEGVPSTDPSSIIKSQRLLTYGEHKGTAIALMIEILAAGLSGGRFAVEYQAGGSPTNPTGQTIIAIDPAAAGQGFTTHLTVLLEAISGNGAARIPGDGRLKRSAVAEKKGVNLSGWLVERLNGLGISLPL